MGSRVLGVPISSANITPKLALSQSGIRAPLTAVESEYESSASSKSRRNSTPSSYCSGSELDFEGFTSGEEDETKRKPYLSGQDGELVEESNINEQFSIVRPFVKNPDGDRVTRGGSSYENCFFMASLRNSGGEIVEKNGSIDGVGFFRPFVRNPDGITFRGLVKANESDDLRSFSSDSDEDLVDGNGYRSRNGSFRPFVAVLDEGSEKESSSDVDYEISLFSKSKRPVAKISRDSDDESQASEILEDDGFLGITPPIRVNFLQKLDSASRFSMLELEKEEDHKNQYENMVDAKVALGLFVGTDDLMSKCDDHINAVNVTDSWVAADRIADKALDVAFEVRDSSLVAPEEHNSPSDMDEEMQEVCGMDDQPELINLIGDVAFEVRDSSLVAPEEHNSLSDMDEEMQEVCGMDDQPELINSIGHKHLIGQAEESMSNGHLYCDIICAELSCQSGPVDTEELEIPELKDKSGMVAVTMNNLLFDQDISGDEFEKLREQKMNQTIETMGNDVHVKETLEDVEEIKYRPNEVFPQLSELPDASISMMNLNQDVLFIAEHSEQPPVEAENQSLLANNNGVVAKMEDQEYANVSGGEILHYHWQETINQTVADSDEEVVVTRNADQFNLNTNYKVDESSSEVEDQVKKIRQIRVKYLQLLCVLGMSPEDTLARKVLYQLSIAEAMSSSKEFHWYYDLKTDMDLEVRPKTDLNFSLSILVIGKTGVGKSATINSIFGEKKAVTDSFEPATADMKEIIGMIDGVKVKVFDSPGLKTSVIDQSHNRKILLSIKKLMQRSPPDIVLYVDRLDFQISNFDDLPLLKTITDYLGSSIWSKAIVALTHASSKLFDGPDGCPLNYELLISQRSRTVQQIIHHSAKELLVTDPGLMTPVSLVENHPSAENTGRGEKLQHDRESWRSQLLLMCYSIKTLSEAKSVVKAKNCLDHGKLFGFKIPSFSLPCVLSSSLKPIVHSKHSSDQRGMNIDSIIEWGFPLEFDRDTYKLLSFKPSMTSKMFIVGQTETKDFKMSRSTPSLCIAIPLPDVICGSEDDDRLTAEKSFTFFANEDAIQTQDDAAYRPAFKLQQNQSLQQYQSSLCFSVMKRKVDHLWECNLESLFSISRNSKLYARAELNKSLRRQVLIKGQVSFETKCSDPLKIGILAFVLATKVMFSNIFPKTGEISLS